jgi:hypothetical protein
MQKKLELKYQGEKLTRKGKKAFDLVIGDQKTHFTRLRDYLQAILDRNPGTRCIVTTREFVGPSKP